MTTFTKRTRWAVLALAILLCAGLFAGCKRQEQENPTGTNPSDSTGGTTDIGDSLYDEDGYLKDRLDPDLDFKGETLSVSERLCKRFFHILPRKIICIWYTK